MKINKIFYILAFIAVFAVSVFAKTSADRSTVIIEYKSSGWIGVNAGWSDDECLISPTHTLDYALHATNRTEYPLSNSQYVIGPELEENWGEMITNEFTDKDSVCPTSAADGTHGDISEFWLTWDANWVYFAAKAEMQHGFKTPASEGNGLNLLILFDRVRDFGIKDFAKDAVWDKAIYTRNFDADFYVGVYGGWGTVSSKSIGGIQYYVVSGSDDNDVKEAHYSPADTGENLNVSLQSSFYNGDYESDIRERVLLCKMKMELFTNSMTVEQLTSCTLKVIVGTVDGGTGAGAFTYDFCPNNLAGMSSDRKTVADNYFLIPFTDTNGQLLMDVRPRYDAKIQYLPGSRSFALPTFTIGLNAINIISGVGFPRSIFVPQKDESASISVTLPKNSNVFEAEIKIYSLRGELMGTVKGSTEGDDDGAWLVSGAVENKTFSYIWDGKNPNGDYVPMGTYLLVFSGMKEDGQEWSERKYISVMH